VYAFLGYVSDRIILASLGLTAVACWDFWTRSDIKLKILPTFDDDRYSPVENERDYQKILERRQVEAIPDDRSATAVKRRTKGSIFVAGLGPRTGSPIQVSITTPPIWMIAARGGRMGGERPPFFALTMSVTVASPRTPRIRCNPGIFARLRSFAANILRFNGIHNVSDGRHRISFGGISAILAMRVMYWALNSPGSTNCGC
jgi:hypothetical protein